jgi:hypothetical protein
MGAERVDPEHMHRSVRSDQGLRPRHAVAAAEMDGLLERLAAVDRACEGELLGDDVVPGDIHVAVIWARRLSIRCDSLSVTDRVRDDCARPVSGASVSASDGYAVIDRR